MEPLDEKLLNSAKSGKKRAGKSHLIAYLSTGKRLIRSSAIKAKCYDCDGMGDTGECILESCPLYPHSPFKSSTPVAQQVKGGAS